MNLMPGATLVEPTGYMNSKKKKKKKKKKEYDWYDAWHLRQALGKDWNKKKPKKPTPPNPVKD